MAVKAPARASSHGDRAKRQHVANQGPTSDGRRPAAELLSLQRALGNRAVQRLVEGPSVQRKCGCGGSCCGGPARALEDIVQRKPAGSSLPSPTRSFMESRLGHDFGGVRVHHDSHAADLAHRLDAQAFTTGQDVYFGAGKYDPGSTSGRALIGHELTHVVQQRNGRSPAGLDSPGDAFERQADSVAQAIASGAPVPRSFLSSPPAVQRANGAGPAPPTQLPASTGAKLEVPGTKAISEADRANLQKRYEDAAGAHALRTKIHAGRGSTSTLWSAWRQSRPFTVADDVIADKKDKCQPDHIIELQLGGPDRPDNLRLLSSSRNQSAGSQLSSNIAAFLKQNGQAEDAVVELTPAQIQVGQNGGGDPECLGWENALARGRAPEAAGAEVLHASVGGLQTTIGWNPDSGLVHAHSRYVVPLVRLNKVTKTGDTYHFEGEWSDRIESVPTSWRKPPNRKFLLKMDGDGGELKFEDPADKLALAFPFLSDVMLDMKFENGDLKASGVLHPTLPLLRNVDITIKIEREKLSAGVSVPPDKLKQALPIPGLEITEANLQLAIERGKPHATGGFALKYSTIADGRVDAEFGQQGFEAVGTLVLHVPGLSEAKGQVWYRQSKLGGRINIGADKLKIPGVKSASLVVTIEDGKLAGEGVVDLAVPGVKQGKLGFGVDEKGNYSISGTAVLDIPGTKEASLGLTYKDGKLEGNAHVGLKIPGLESATFDVLYKDGQLSGSGSLSYKKGKLAGTVTINLSPQHKLSGSGELAYEIAPGLVAFAGLQIREDGTTKISGGLRVPETIDIFKRKEVEKTLFKLPTIEIPILAIPLGTRSVGIVATIDAKLIARAGVGPGQLRKVKLLVELDPSKEESSFAFHASAELYVPADAELALQIAGGIGVSLAIVRAVGGIEAEGAAGLKAEFIAGADVSYQNGQLAVEGKAELSAQPRLIFRLKAFVRVEADIFITTIEIYNKEWTLAQFEAGSALKVGVRIPFKYVFGQPFQLSLDQIEFIVPEIKPMDLIKELLPK